MWRVKEIERGSKENIYCLTFSVVVTKNFDSLLSSSSKSHDELHLVSLLELGYPCRMK